MHRVHSYLEYGVYLLDLQGRMRIPPGLPEASQAIGADRGFAGDREPGQAFRMKDQSFRMAKRARSRKSR